MIDDEVDVNQQAWHEGFSDGFNAGYADAIEQVTAEMQRMFHLDKPQQARFNWVLKRVKEEAGLTL